MAAVLREAALAGDAKMALEVLKHQHAWVAKQQISVDVEQRISIIGALEMAQQGEGGRAFVRIHSQLRGEAGDLGLALRRQAFGASTERYVSALCSACPHLSAEAVYWRFNFMVGSYLVVSSQAGRLEDYSGGACAATNMQAALEQLVPFAIAGFLAAPPGAPAGAPRGALRP
jgi:hypothetical protein